jgi:hypothetical protein
MILENPYRVRNDLEDPDEREDPWLFRGNPRLINVYSGLIERRK